MAGLLPAWIPTDALFLGLLVLVIGAIAMNWDKRWTVTRVMNLNEPLIVGVGVLIAAMSARISSAAGVGSADMWLAIGILVSLFGVFAWFSDSVDL